MWLSNASYISSRFSNPAVYDFEVGISSNFIHCSHGYFE